VNVIIVEKFFEVKNANLSLQS